MHDVIYEWPFNNSSKPKEQPRLGFNVVAIGIALAVIVVVVVVLVVNDDVVVVAVVGVVVAVMTV